MTLQIKFSQRAKRGHPRDSGVDKESICEGCRNWLAALEKCISHLSEFAASSAAAPEADDLGIHLLQRMFKTRRGNSYRLLFIICAETVHILALRGMGQDLLHDGDIDIPGDQ